MAECVRIEHFEAEDIRAIIEDYYGQGYNDYLIEDLVNRIGEVYEKALARKSQASA